jgi:hypothetical protein
LYHQLEGSGQVGAGGRQLLHRPVVGDVELCYEGLDLPADPGWHLYTFTAAPGSPSDDRLRLFGQLGRHPRTRKHRQPIRQGGCFRECLTGRIA